MRMLERLSLLSECRTVVWFRPSGLTSCASCPQTLQDLLC